ncbi:MAG TPA: class I SAM-dependent methyltransferase [Methanosarcina sp.]
MDTKEVIQNYWDYRSESYNNGVIENSEEERNAWRAMLSKSIEEKKGLKVLDVGTGPGFLALLFAEMENEVTAVDLSNNMLEKARKNALKKSLNINFLHGDAENLQLPDGYFDVVVNRYLLWTLPEPKKALTEWKRVLKDGGTIIAIDGDWNEQKLSRRIWIKASDFLRGVKEGKYMKKYKKQYDPIKKDLPLFSLKPEHVSNIFKDSGFESVSIQRMDEPSRLVRKKGSLLDKLYFSNPVYFIKAEK